MIYYVVIDPTSALGPAIIQTHDETGGLHPSLAEAIRDMIFQALLTENQDLIICPVALDQPIARFTDANPDDVELARQDLADLITND
jgi:hypothetical protein